MDNQKNLVSFLAVMSVLLIILSVNVSSATSELATGESIEINGITETGGEDISVIAGETLGVQVIFEALENASNVRLKAELEGTKVDSETEVFLGDVEKGMIYKKTLKISVPYELQDEVSEDIALEIKVWNGDFKTEFDEITLRVQRPSYNVGVMSISSGQTAVAGESFPVDVVLKNTGYNRIDDLYLVVKIAALELEAKAYLGDLVELEEDDSDDKEGDTIRARLFLNVPYDARTGIYTLEVEASNKDVVINKAKQIFVENELPKLVIKSGSDLILLNPTNKLKVYTLVVDGHATVSDSTIVVPAGSSRTVDVRADSGESFTVNVFSGDKIVGASEFTGTEAKTTSSVVAVLTVILAIIFIVLLIVLIVLLTKKPEKEEEFGESYY